MFKFFRRLTAKNERSETSHSNKYHAVCLHYDRRQACEAVRALEQQVFLPDQAPELPLPECTRRGSCRCTYRHQTDRRSNLRRDIDHGLPTRYFEADDRRSGVTDRRRQRVA